MSANCKNADFRKKTGVPKKVACDYHDQDKGIWHEDITESSSDTAFNAAKSLQSLLKRNGSNIDFDDIEVTDFNGTKKADFGVRYFGHWVVPDDAEDDGDYDWKIPTDNTKEKIQKLVRYIMSEYPVKVHWSVEEKYWIYFSIVEIIKESNEGSFSKVKENIMKKKNKLTESFLTPLEQIAMRIHNGEFSELAPKVADKDIQRKFREAVRSTYGHAFENEATRNIFNKAWFTGKDNWVKLAEEYDRITREVAPETIFDANALIGSIISEADLLMKDSNFLANPKDIRRQVLIRFIKDKVAEAIQERSTKRELVQAVIEHYENKYNITLKQMLSEDDDELEDLEPLEKGDDLDDMLDSDDEEKNDDDLDKPIEHNPTDTIKFDVPLMIRILEFAREDISSDVVLHRLATNLIREGKDGKTLTMDDYETLILDINGSEINYLRTLAGIGPKEKN